MRWDDLFDELEAEFDAALRREQEEEIPHLVHAEAATVSLADRIRHRVGQRLHVRLRTGDLREGTVDEANHAWTMLHDGPRRSLIPHTGVAYAWPLAGAAPELKGISARLTLGYALRKIAESGMTVRLLTLGGELHGRVGLVGTDYIDVHTPTAALAVAWDAIVCIEQ